MLWVQWWFLTRITYKDWHRIKNSLFCATNILFKFHLEKHPDQEWTQMRKDARSTELKSIIMTVMWERSRGALPFNAMGGIRFRESRWRVTSWPHTWLPAALSLSVRGPPAAELSESPLRCHVCRSTVCSPPLRVPRAPLSADGAYWSTAEDVTFALQIRLHGRTLTVWWGGEMSLGFAREINSIRHANWI